MSSRKLSFFVFCSFIIYLTLGAGFCGINVPPNPIPTPTITPIPTTTTTSTTSTTTTTTLLPLPITHKCHKIPGPTNCIENVVNQAGVYKDQVNASLEEVTRCHINSTCQASDWKDIIVKLMANLNSKGFCSSYDTQGGNAGLGSELGVRRDEASVEFYQPITSSSLIRWASPRSVCRPAFDEKTIEEVKEEWKIIPPKEVSCPVKVEENHFVDLHIGMIGNNPQQYSATAKYCGFPVRNDIFNNCGTKCCTLGVDGGNQAAVDCEIVLSGQPGWLGTDSLQIIPAFDGNPYNVKVVGGRGSLKACGKSGCSNDIIFP